MAPQIQAFAPANISCLFKVYPHPDSAQKGSYGMGFTIEEGVTATVRKAERVQVLWNNTPTSIPSVEYVLASLTSVPLHVHLSSPLPLGSGYGLSGASALSTAYAVNVVLDCRKTPLELAGIAHVAEVQAKTGLGDVVNQYFGGALLKMVPSSKFEVIRLNVPHVPVYCRYFNSLSTAAILSDPERVKQLEQAADYVLPLAYELSQKSDVSFAEMLTLAYDFVVKSGLLTDAQTKQTIEEIHSRGGRASMILLGHAVMSDIPFEGSSPYTLSSTAAHVVMS